MSASTAQITSRRPPVPRVSKTRAPRVPGARPKLRPWLRAQAINVTRHAAALRPFQRAEFGPSSAAPSEGHIHAVNDLMTSLRRNLLGKAKKVSNAARAAVGNPTTENLQAVVTYKERSHDWVRAVERVWDFYFELFGQRQSRFGDWLLSC